MNLRKISGRTLGFSAVLFGFVPLLSAEAQDVDVPGNLTMHDSADPTVGNVLKEGVPFLHNFGTNNTFLGSGTGNFTMTGRENTASGSSALSSNTAGNANTAHGLQALRSNTTGGANTAIGLQPLWLNSTGQGNTASGYQALWFNTTGDYNTASGVQALITNTTGYLNTATGVNALLSNTTGYFNTANGFLSLQSNTTGGDNTAVGHGADVSTGDLFNATAIGAGAVVNASNKIRFGNTAVTVIEGEVPYTYTSDRNEKENFHAVDADAVLAKLRRLSVTSWNYKGQDAKQFRHYGPVAQDFFAAFGHDAVGTVGTPTTITSGDLDGILMIAVQALEKRTLEHQKQIADLKAELEGLRRRVGREVAANVSAWH